MFASLLAGFRGLFVGSQPNEFVKSGFRERRKLVRLRCSYEVKGILKGKKFKATVVDIGVNGMKLRTGQKLKVGEKLALAPPNASGDSAADSVECKVVWVKQPNKHFLTYAGLVFSASKEKMARSWVKSYLNELGFTPKSIFTQRRFIRADCFLEVRYDAPVTGKKGVGRVYNMGVGGLLVETVHELPLGQAVSLTFDAKDGLPEMTLTAYPVQFKNDGKVKVAGMEFRDLQDLELERLGVYLKHLLKASWAER
jgi:c-di-GMP-binding flagellar brake protein YcgR